MSNALLKVQFAGPLVTIQDGGRVGHLRYGVPASGPMDRLSFAAANAALGNGHDQSCIEISLGGLALECTEGAISLAVSGGDFSIEHDGTKSSGWRVLTLRQGERLAIRGGQSGSWTYLAFAGELRTKSWLGHAATLSTSGFGGGALQANMELVAEHSAIQEDREGEIARPDFSDIEQRIRVVMGPQDNWFKQEAITAFQNTDYAVTDSYDRMGMRLKGTALPLDGALAIPSEPIIRGSVQVSGEGVPTILLADHQTTGGYPKIATVISSDLDRLVQMRSGETIKFQSISPSEALGCARERSKNMAIYLEKLSIRRGSLLQRLMSENLITVADAE